MSTKSDPRSAPNNLPLTYDRPPHLADRRPSPSPGPSNGLPFYDRYAPARSSSAYQDNYASGYTANSWRPERSFYSGTPSPECHGQQRDLQAEGWAHPPSWTPSDSMTWAERREPIGSMYDSPAPRGRRETMAERMFEPSDSWKQTHIDSSIDSDGARDRPGDQDWNMRSPQRTVPDHYSPPRNHYSPSQDHYSPSRNHYSPPRNHYSPPRDLYSPTHDQYSPTRNHYSPPRDHYSPPMFESDHYRPHSPSPPYTPRYPYMNPGSDSYRPHYENDRGPWSVRPPEPRPKGKGRKRNRRRFISRDRSISINSVRALPLSSLVTSRGIFPPQNSSATLRPANGDGAFAFLRPASPSGAEQPPCKKYRSCSPIPPPNIGSRQMSEVVAERNGVISHPDDYDSLASTPHDDSRTLDFPAPVSVSFKQEILEDLPAPEPVASSGTDRSGRHAETKIKAEDLPASRSLKIDTCNMKIPAEMRPEATLSRPSVNGLEISSEKQVTSVSAEDTSSVADGSDMEMSLPASPTGGSAREEQYSSPHLSPVPAVPFEKGVPIADDNRLSLAEDSDMEMSPPPSPSDRFSAESGTRTPSGRHGKVRERSPSPILRQLVVSEAEKDKQIKKPDGTLQVAVRLEAMESSGTHDFMEESDVDMEISTPATPAHPADLRAPSVGSSTAVDEEIPGLQAILPSSEVVSNDLAMERPKLPLQVPSLTMQTVDGKIPFVDASPLVMSPRTPPGLDAAPTVSLEPPGGTGDKAPSALDGPERAGEDEARTQVQPSTTTPAMLAAPVTPAVTPATLAAVQNQQTKEGSGVLQEAEQGTTNAQRPKPLSEGLRLVVMTRLRCDRQTREERVNPVLHTNLSIVEALPPQSSSSSSPDAVIRTLYGGERGRAREAAFARMRPSLQQRFAQRQAALTEKVRTLREEYISLHERWMAHCAKLDEVTKTAALEEAAATAGRTTRRTAALTDAVRSDLEMEQIIASLGNEELTDANHLGSRNAATIPDMISVTTGSVDLLYDDTNNRVDDPSEFYAPQTGMDDWSEEEKAIFLEKWVEHPKQFGLIADYLPHKTAAQCVTYYYLHKHTLIDFRKVLSRHTSSKRKRGGKRADKKKGNALLTDIRKHDAEVSRDSTPGAPTTRRKRGAPAVNNELKRAASRRGSAQVEQSPISTPTPGPDPEPRRRKRQPKPTARAIALMEQESAEVSVEPEPRPRRGRKSRKVVKSAEIVVSPGPDEEMPTVMSGTKFIDQTDFTTRKKPMPGGVIWSEEDKVLFLKLLAQYGDDFKRIAASMPNKTTIQVSQFYKANLAEWALEKVAAGAPKRSPTPDRSQDMWKETSIPGSGVITPSTNCSTPDIQAPMQGLPPVAIETRFRVNGHGSPSRKLHIQEMFTSAERDQRQVVESSTAGQSSGYQFRSTSIESMRAQYGPTDNMPARGYVPIQPRTSPYANIAPPIRSTNGSLMDNTINGASQAPPATLTMTFQSNFAYSNLSPSHFANDQRPAQRMATRNVSPPGATSSATMTFDASMFPQQTWTHRSLHTPTPALPATLQTTEDLVAYLEHRTRQTAQQLDFQ
ncbi:hypothetical protein SCP_1400990 [Sparassis crispa]|uniref:SANT domain-containing protein n=1 Tax=Sparassis crispa TaxID=139825 RepID=A0A401H2P3_9APHY|nr:hypothetical protein SCP_1400990 [Sparassis crispa]GBE88694.1 hypothetical protein SCP_1400990 [Sparassis crispa]